MRIFYKGNCGYCKKAINGRDYIWVSTKEGLMHKKCYELYKKEINLKEANPDETDNR